MVDEIVYSLFKELPGDALPFNDFHYPDEVPSFVYGDTSSDLRLDSSCNLAVCGNFTGNR